jgi:hypothetical protein
LGGLGAGRCRGAQSSCLAWPAPSPAPPG